MVAVVMLGTLGLTRSRACPHAAIAIVGLFDSHSGQIHLVTLLNYDSLLCESMGGVEKPEIG